MNELFNARLEQTLLWVLVTGVLGVVSLLVPEPRFWFVLTLAALATVLINLAVLTVFRGKPTGLAKHLTILGGLLASLYGHGE